MKKIKSSNDLVNRVEKVLTQKHPKLNKNIKIMAYIITAILVFVTCATLYTTHFEQTNVTMSGIELHKIKPKAANVTPLVRYQLKHTNYGIVNYSSSDGLHSTIINLDQHKIVKDQILDMTADGTSPMILAQLLHDIYQRNNNIKLTNLQLTANKITLNQTKYHINAKATNLISYTKNETQKSHYVKTNPNFLLLGDGTKRTFKKEQVDVNAIQVNLVQFDAKTKQNIITFLDYNSGKYYRLTLDLKNNVSLTNLK